MLAYIVNLIPSISIAINIVDAVFLEIYINASMKLEKIRRCEMDERHKIKYLNRQDAAITLTACGILINMVISTIYFICALCKSI